MALDINLMGLGIAPLQAARTANGGTGPVTATAKGTSPTTAYQIGGAQFVVSFTATSGGGCATLPALGGSDMAATIADDFVIHNATAGNMTVFSPSGMTVNIGGAQYSGASGFTLAQFKTLTFYPITATTGFGLSA